MAVKEGEKYEVLEKIGQGSFGIIRKVRRKDNGQILCRKEISYSRMSEKEKEQLYAELKILESLKHPNIVQYCHREHIKSCNDLHLYMEYCGNGDLGGYIKKLKERNQLADEEFVWSIFAQLVGALYRCHYGEDPPVPGQEGVGKKAKAFQTKEGYRVILHRDLKPENVFLSQNNAVKLGDFGLSKIIAAHDFASTYVGTPFYMSPEICAAERYSHHSDVWSLGCIIYELASRCVPFDARSHVELVMKIKNGRIKPLPTTYSQDLTDVISWCLKVDPRSRPDTAQLLNVTQIKLARARLEQSMALEVAKGDLIRIQQERDALFIKLQASTKQNQDLQSEIVRLKEVGKKIEMEWHARATLAIDQRVSEEMDRLRLDLERQLGVLRQDDEAKIEKRIQEELHRRLSSLATAREPVDGESASRHIRSSTPPLHKPSANSSFTTQDTAATSFDDDVSSVRESDSLETDLSSPSLLPPELGEDVSPLAQRVKPMKKPRQPLGRAKTLAHCRFEATNSPRDVHMADPSPMISHIKGLSLSPRRSTQSRPAGFPRSRNIFSLAAEQRLRPAVGDEVTSFADDDILDEEDEYRVHVDDSPSRPTSGLSSHSAHEGDPFKSMPAVKGAPTKRPRPSLGRQQTMPVNIQASAMHQRAKSTNTTIRSANISTEKENRPPLSDRNDVLVNINSPKRLPISKDGRDLTPSRKAPPPPLQTAGLGHGLTAKSNSDFSTQPGTNSYLSPSRVQGKTLVELQQTRLRSSNQENSTSLMKGLSKHLPSPAKWDLTDEEMPSPFLARKVRMMIR